MSGTYSEEQVRELLDERERQTVSKIFDMLNEGAITRGRKGGASMQIAVVHDKWANQLILTSPN